jgi:hypothetical protein
MSVMPMFGNQFFTAMDDTIVSSSTIFDALTSDAAAAIVIKGKTRVQTPIVVTNANVALTQTNLQQAVLSSQLVTSSGILTPGFSLTVGEDTAINAKAIQISLGIETLNSSVTLTFALTSTQGDFPLNLANTSGTFTNVQVILEGISVSDSQIFAIAGSASGELTVIATATNVTAGSEVVTLNIVSQGTGVTISSTGTAILAVGGPGALVVVPAAAITANSTLLVTRKDPGGTIGNLYANTIVAGTGFTINSDAAETSTVYWSVVHRSV